MLQSDAPALILASASAARHAVLHRAGLRFTARAAGVDEAEVKNAARIAGLDAGVAALSLARLKAATVADDDALVIGCDQILTCGATWFDKPADLPEARTHLLALRGRTHVLHTAVTCVRNGVRLWEHVDRPSLTMRNFTMAFLDDYLVADSEAVLHTVGAYRVEGPGIQLFSAIDGAHSAIMGLPLLPLLGFLRECGILTP